MAKATGYMPHTGPIVTRAEAKAAGDRFFFTGLKCRHGHIAQRYVAQGLCVECAKAAANRQRADDPMRHQALLAAWRKANPERVNALNQKWADANPERVRAYQKQWRIENRDTIRARTMAWREANRERWDEAAREWQKANLDRVKVSRANRRTKVRGNGGSHTPEQIADLLAKQRQRCVGCGASIRKNYEADHIIPVSRGGTSDISNIQLLCRPCNRGKHTKSQIQWAREQGRLL
jgi:5-methylcytosine-specific restriction endonuclease McrA